MIHVQHLGGILNPPVTIVDESGRVLAKGKQGDTLRFVITEPTEIEVRTRNTFGASRHVVSPGERYRARTRGMNPRYYFELVDTIIG